jgi:Tfp pilus assembly protein PilF
MSGEGSEFLESGLRLDPQNIHLLEKLARLHLDAGALDEATNQYLRIAEASLVRGDVTRAVRSMESARDCCPDDVEIRRNLAEIYVPRAITRAPAANSSRWRASISPRASWPTPAAISTR